jgi:hypothetical protein
MVKCIPSPPCYTLLRYTIIRLEELSKIIKILKKNSQRQLLEHNPELRITKPLNL